LKESIVCKKVAPIRQADLVSRGTHLKIKQNPKSDCILKNETKTAHLTALSALDRNQRTSYRNTYSITQLVTI
jgi:hypothetical protein